jgi:hypothetical protein
MSARRASDTGNVLVPIPYGTPSSLRPRQSLRSLANVELTGPSTGVPRPASSLAGRGVVASGYMRRHGIEPRKVRRPPSFDRDVQGPCTLPIGRMAEAMPSTGNSRALGLETGSAA